MEDNTLLANILEEILYLKKMVENKIPEREIPEELINEKFV